MVDEKLTDFFMNNHAKKQHNSISLFTFILHVQVTGVGNPLVPVLAPGRIQTDGKQCSSHVVATLNSLFISIALIQIMWENQCKGSNEKKPSNIV